MRWLTHATGRIDKHRTVVTREMCVQVAGRTNPAFAFPYNDTRGPFAYCTLTNGDTCFFNWRWPDYMTELVSINLLLTAQSTGSWDWQIDYQGTATGGDTSGGSESNDSGQTALLIRDLTELDCSGAVTSSTWVAEEMAALKVTQTSSVINCGILFLHIVYKEKLVR